MLSIYIYIYNYMDVVVHPSHSTEKRTVLAWIRTGDLWVSNEGIDNCMLIHRLLTFF